MIPLPASPPFIYTTGPRRVVFGSGAAGGLAEEVAALGARRVLLVTTPGGESRGEATGAALGGALAGIFAGARTHVPEEVAEEAGRAARRARAEALVALGGGSAVGVAKAVALRTGLPILAVPTTYSGSEMTSVWGVTSSAGKRTGRDDRVRPRTVVYDPDLTLALAPDLTARSGMNAIAHAVEALYAPDGGPVPSLLAEEAIRTLARSLTRLATEPGDEEARAGALYGAHLAGWALDLTSMGLHHGLCHALGGTFDLPHATVHAVLLPHVTGFNAGAAPTAMAHVAGALGSLGLAGAAAGLFDLGRALGIRETLRDLGLEPADLDRAAELAVEREYPNPRPAAEAEVRQLLDRAWRGVRPNGD